MLDFLWDLVQMISWKKKYDVIRFYKSNSRYRKYFLEFVSSKFFVQFHHIKEVLKENSFSHKIQVEVTLQI